MNRQEKSRFLSEVGRGDLVEIDYFNKRRLKECMGVVGSKTNFSIMVEGTKVYLKDIGGYSVICKGHYY